MHFLNYTHLTIIKTCYQPQKKMATNGQKLCLHWNDFRENVSTAFGDLRQDKEFTDVTLACEDGQQVEAHKVVHVASSPFFLNILKRNKHPHPLIYMRGVTPENLKAMVDFIYHGKANVYQVNLESFLALAEELQLKGLGRNQTATEAEIVEENSTSKSTKYISATKQFLVNKNVFDEKGLVQESEQKLFLTNEATNIFDIESLDRQVKSMMTFSENANPYKNRGGRAKICKVCGKEGSMTHIKDHIEANHIAGISIPCGLCGQIVRTRHALQMHKSRHHGDQ